MQKHKTKSVLIGDMLELGPRSERLHYEAGLEASKHRIDKIYAFGRFARDIKDGALIGGFSEDRIAIFDSTKDHGEVAEFIKERADPDELILVKGSHSIHLEKIIELWERT